MILLLYVHETRRNTASAGAGKEGDASDKMDKTGAGGVKKPKIVEIQATPSFATIEETEK